jgi:hypothetical protein
MYCTYVSATTVVHDAAGLHNLQALSTKTMCRDCVVCECSASQLTSILEDEPCQRIGLAWVGSSDVLGRIQQRLHCVFLYWEKKSQSNIYGASE